MSKTQIQVENCPHPAVHVAGPRRAEFGGQRRPPFSVLLFWFKLQNPQIGGPFWLPFFVRVDPQNPAESASKQGPTNVTIFGFWPALSWLSVSPYMDSWESAAENLPVACTSKKHQEPQAMESHEPALLSSKQRVTAQYNAEAKVSTVDRWLVHVKTRPE